MHFLCLLVLSYYCEGRLHSTLVGIRGQLHEVGSLLRSSMSFKDQSQIVRLTQQVPSILSPLVCPFMSYFTHVAGLVLVSYIIYGNWLWMSYKWENNVLDSLSVKQNPFSETNILLMPMRTKVSNHPGGMLQIFSEIWRTESYSTWLSTPKVEFVFTVSFMWTIDISWCDK